ncbi:hypothetical protein Droror1_Dr00000944 [Drosera rotundifolia]
MIFFVLEDKEFWVLLDNTLLNAKEAQDSRTFGPIKTNDIIGRVIYRFLSPSSHGPVASSDDNAEEDSAILELELDIDELEKRH